MSLKLVVLMALPISPRILSELLAVVACNNGPSSCSGPANSESLASSSWTTKNYEVFLKAAVMRKWQNMIAWKGLNQLFNQLFYFTGKEARTGEEHNFFPQHSKSVVWERRLQISPLSTSPMTQCSCTLYAVHFPWSRVTDWDTKWLGFRKRQIALQKVSSWEKGIYTLTTAEFMLQGTYYSLS